MLRCEGGSLYTGITNDLVRRLRQHRGELAGGAKYTKSHPPTGIAGIWTAPDHKAAARLEYYLHRCSRTDKLALLGSPITLEKTGETFIPLDPAEAGAGGD